MIIDEGSDFVGSRGENGAIIDIVFIHVERYKIKEEFHAVELDVRML